MMIIATLILMIASSSYHHKLAGDTLRDRVPAPVHYPPPCPSPPLSQAPEAEVRRKGTDGVSTNGVTANRVCFLTEGVFGDQSVNICQHLSSLRTFFLNLSKTITFAGTRLVLTPFVRDQGASGAGAPGRGQSPPADCGQGRGLRRRVAGAPRLRGEDRGALPAHAHGQGHSIV